MEFYYNSVSLGLRMAYVQDGCIRFPFASLCPNLFSLNLLSNKVNDILGSNVCHRINGITIEQKPHSILIVFEDENDRNLYVLVHVK